MKEFDTNWSKEELKAYILIYCANADFSELKAEKDLIVSKIKGISLERIHDEFDKDNDYQSIQKIRLTLEKYGYSKDGVNRLYQEMKELFLSDGKFDTSEQNLFRGLSHIIEYK